MSALQKLGAKRKALRIRVTACVNRQVNYENLTETQRTAEKIKILDIKTELLQLDEIIQDKKFGESEKFEEVDLDTEMETCSDYHEKIQDCLSFLDSLGTTSKSGTTTQVDVARSLLRQPTAPLPTFSGKEDEDLLKFLKEFELTTAVFHYPDRDLLLLLNQQCSGNALTLLNSLETDKQTYKSAKELLIAAFASETKRKFSTIRQLSELNLAYQDDPFEYISKVMKICESVKTLEIKSDDFLQFFIWKGLNKTFQLHLTQITSETIPKLDKILDRYFEANERYQQSQMSMKTKKTFTGSSSGKAKSSSSYAISAKTESLTSHGCFLCNEGDHKFYSCPKYPSSKDKCEKFKLLGGCTKCGKMNHKVEKCRVMLQSKCRKCREWHLSSLCPRDSVGAQSMGGGVKPKSVEIETNTRVAILPHYNSGSILPTFSFRAKGKLIRGLSDRASEGTFVTEKIADSLKLKVLKNNVKLIVSGFNKSQEYLSRLVLIPVEFGEVKANIHALVVPYIQMNLSLPDVGFVVRAFEEKGYKLADSLLKPDSTEIKEIDFVLGSDFSNMLPGRDISFGKNSMYVESSLGVLLLGNVGRVMEDLSSLGASRKINSNMVAIPQAMDLHPHYIVNVHAFLISKPTFSVSNEDIDDLNLPSVKFDQNCNVFDKKGKLLTAKLQNATDQVLDYECDQYLGRDISVYNDETVELHEQLVDYTLGTLHQSEDGRLVVPLLWNGKVSSHLAKNKRLAKLILNSNLKKLKKDGGESLVLVDRTIKDQLKEGIIEKVEDVDKYLAENPGYSFLPHMSIFKPERETTKVRIVFLSNLGEKEGKRVSLSHNQVMYSGPTLNQKLSSALLHLRFGKYLLTYDLKKAFNQLVLSESDQSKVLFYWFKNVDKGDFSLVVYKNVRLSFGLRCSPFLLMIVMFYILVLNVESDPVKLKNLKHLMYNLLYMDNGAITSDDKEYLGWAYNELENIFSPYGFKLQQMVTNEGELQKCISKEHGDSSEVVKLLGICWNRRSDTLYTKPINLDVNANTKRTILKSIASQFDVYNYNMPLLNRSRLFMHQLQCDKNLGWDTKLSPQMCREWVNICKQVNVTPSVEVSRYVGPREGNYKLYVFTDASHVLYGSVIYLYNEETQALSFVCAKNKMVNRQLCNKSIPSLELNAITLGVEAVLEIYRDLTHPACVTPIKVNEIYLFSDSICCLHWLNSATNKMDKLTKLSVFVKNRLQVIQDMCEKVSIRFKFIEGEKNPADCITRCLSYKQLMKSNFLSGPNLDLIIPHKVEIENDLDVVIPNPKFSDVGSIKQGNTLVCNISCAETDDYPSLLNPANFSSFLDLLYLYRRLLLCAQTWKNKTLKHSRSVDDDIGLYAKAIKAIIQADQKLYYPDVVNYFSCPMSAKKDIPPAVSRFNLFMDHDEIIRVKAKFRKWRYNPDNKFPILLHKDSHLTDIIISDIHKQISHAGCYAILSELRKNFFLPQHFSKINKFLKSCTHCLRFNARTLKLNQGQYREFRENPPKTPFANVFVDYLGPFYIRTKEKEKVWLLCITCCWSRAVNIKVCSSLNLKDFLRAFQLHIYEYGVPQLFISDLGSQITAGINVIKDIVNDPEVNSYFDFHCVKPITFQQYFKGCSQLGSMVEICVKMIKRLIFGSIKNNVLNLSEFEFLVCYIKHLINQRPIAFKDELKTSKLSIPEPITPEHLIRGYEPTSLNIIPELLPLPPDKDWSPTESPANTVKDSYFKLQKIQSNVKEIYNNEFIRTLISQAVDQKDRFQPVTHKGVRIGDIVLLKEVNTKPNYYPLAIVRDVLVNNLGEVTGAIVFKGKTRELVKRHASTIIPLLQTNDADYLSESNNGHSNFVEDKKRPTRKAAIVGRAKTQAMLINE